MKEYERIEKFGDDPQELERIRMKPCGFEKYEIIEGFLKSWTIRKNTRKHKIVREKMKKCQRIQENSAELNESGRIREGDRTRKNQQEFYIIPKIREEFLGVRENPEEFERTRKIPRGFARIQRNLKESDRIRPNSQRIQENSGEFERIRDTPRESERIQTQSKRIVGISKEFANIRENSQKPRE